MEKDTRKICGTCRYHYHEEIDDGWVCVNSDSVSCADFIQDAEWCDAYEER